MFKKTLTWMIMILIAITLITLASFVLWEYMMKDNHTDPEVAASQVQAKKMSAKEIGEQTIKIEDVTTNLADSENIVRISFAFLLNSKKGKEEMETIRHLVEAAILRTLSDTTAEEIKGSQGMDALAAKLLTQVNPILRVGKVNQIDITKLIISEQR